MFYSNGNYEAFIRPRKPKGVDGKSAYLIGGGIASLAAAGFLIRDGQMDGKRITVYEASNISRRLPGRHRGPKGGLPLPRRARDGGPLRVPVGSDALDPVARCQGRLGA